MTDCTVPKKVFWQSHRFWWMVGAAGGSLASAASTFPIPLPAPVMIGVRVAGWLLTLVGGIGATYYSFKSPGTVVLKKSEATEAK